jgi:hypothetical protein
MPKVTARPYGSPSGDPAAGSGEVGLAIAVLQRAAADLHVRSTEVRRAALQFWQDLQAVAPWAEMVDLDPAALMAAVHQHQQHTAPARGGRR